MQYLRARWYDSSTGRFVSEDSYEGDITNPLSLNLYTYVFNNPLIYVDPTGNWCESVGSDGTPDGQWAHPGLSCDNPNNLFSDDSMHDGDSILEWGNEVDTFEYDYSINGASEDNGIGGFVFDTVITLEVPASTSAAKSLGSKVLSIFGKKAISNVASTSAKELAFIGGNAGEAFLAKNLGAVAKDQLQVSMPTSLGIRRIDVLVDGIAHESKVGYVKYSQSVIRQIEKDAELMAKGRIDGATWNFYRSGITGQVGADQRILDLLTQYGIRYIIN